MTSFLTSYQVRPEKYRSSILKSDHLAGIMKKLNEDRKSKQQYCDVTIQAESGAFPVHLAVISSYSEFFDRLFNAEMKEKHEKVARIFKISEETMESILNFIYTSEITITKTNVCDVLKAADYFQIQSVKEFCLKFMLDEVDFENCLSYKAFGRLFDCDVMTEKVGHMISARLDLVLEGEEFKDLYFEEFEELLKLEHRKVSSQEILYNSVISWICHHLEERRQHLEALFDFVNIDKLSRGFLLDIVSNESLIMDSCECSSRLFKVLLKRVSVSSKKHKEWIESSSSNTFGTSVQLTDSRKLTMTSQNQWSQLKEVEISQSLFQSELDLTYNQLLESMTNKTQAEEERFKMAMKWIRINEAERKQFLPQLMSLIDVSRMSDVFLLRQVQQEVGDIFGNLKFGRNSSSVVHHNGKIYVIGGYKTKTVECLDLTHSASNWEERSPMGNIRVGAAATVYRDYIYVMGGRVSSSISATSHKSSTGEKLNVTSQRWSHIPSCYEAKAFHALVQVNGLLYALGTQSAEVLHPRFGTWRRISPLLVARTGMAAVALRGKIYAIGGYNNDYLSSVEVYDCDADNWSFVSAMNEARSFHGACVVNGKIYVAGGNSDVIEMYNPQEDKWEIEQRICDIKWMDCVVAMS